MRRKKEERRTKQREDRERSLSNVVTRPSGKDGKMGERAVEPKQTCKWRRTKCHKKDSMGHPNAMGSYGKGGNKKQPTG